METTNWIWVPYPASCWVNCVTAAGFPMLGFRVSFRFLSWRKNGWLALCRTCLLEWIFGFSSPASRRSLFSIRTASAKSGLSDLWVLDNFLPIPKFSRVVIALHTSASMNDLRAQICPIAGRNLHSIRFSTEILCPCRFEKKKSVEELFHNSSFSPFIINWWAWWYYFWASDLPRRPPWFGPFKITKLRIDNVSNFCRFNFRVRSLGILHVPHVQKTIHIVPYFRQWLRCTLGEISHISKNSTLPISWIISFRLFAEKIMRLILLHIGDKCILVWMILYLVDQFAD